jgi:hypothetical protein
MIFILLAMLVILVVAGLVVVYVAYPHRGQEMPNAPWVGEALKKTVDAVPTFSTEDEVAEAEPHQGPEQVHQHDHEHSGEERPR